MISFKETLSKLGDTVKKTANTLSEKSSDLIEITKLNKAIKEEEEKISQGITAIGNNVYESYLSGKEVIDLKSSCDSITEMQNKITSMKNQIETIKTEPKSKDTQNFN